MLQSLTILFEVLCVLALVVALVWFSPRALKRALLMRTLLRKPNPHVTPPPVPAWTNETALPHSELRQLAPNLWVVMGTLPQPGPKFKRTMTVYRRPGTKQLTLHSVVAVNDKVRQEIEGLGEVSLIIVPNYLHTLDIAAYHDRYPTAAVVCPRSAVDIVKGLGVKVVSSCEEKLGLFGGAHGVSCLAPEDGSPVDDNAFELVYSLDLEGGKGTKRSALVVTDFFFNISDESADPVTRFMGSAGGFRRTAIGCLMSPSLQSCKEWIESVLLSNVDAWGVECIVVGHGDVVEGGANVKLALETACARMKR